jgi:hypothetical protein
MIHGVNFARSDDLTGFAEANNVFIFLPAKTSMPPSDRSGGMDSRKKFFPARSGVQ